MKYQEMEQVKENLDLKNHIKTLEQQVGSNGKEVLKISVGLQADLKVSLK